MDVCCLDAAAFCLVVVVVVAAAAAAVVVVFCDFCGLVCIWCVCVCYGYNPSCLDIKLQQQEVSSTKHFPCFGYSRFAKNTFHCSGCFTTIGAYVC